MNSRFSSSSSNPSNSPSSPISPLSRLIRLVAIVSAIGANFIFGIIPGMVLFFGWVEQNCVVPESLRKIPFFDWPWISFSEAPLMIRCVWNVALFLAFGAIHSLLAQKSAQKRILQIIPGQLMRTFYLCVTGLSLIGMMGLWQVTDVPVWSIPMDPFLSKALSFGIFWTQMLLAGYLLTRFGILEFFGIQQLWMQNVELNRTEGTPKLIVSGLYRWVRHPVYTLTLMAFLLTPEMNLDRILIFLGTVLYLIFGIYFEEKKLIRQFGAEYLKYRAQVPAIVPRWVHFEQK